MSFDSYKSLIKEGTLAQRPATPDQSDFRQFYYAKDVDTTYMWSPTLAQWVSENGFISSITAAGATQGNATPITSSKVIVATATVSTHGVLLPAASTGLEVKIINIGPTFPTKVYPNTHGIINGGASNAADATTLAAFKTTIYQARDTQHWVTLRGA